jgi:hypothetical protein
LTVDDSNDRVVAQEARPSPVLLLNLPSAGLGSSKSTSREGEAATLAQSEKRKAPRLGDWMPEK